MFYLMNPFCLLALFHLIPHPITLYSILMKLETCLTTYYIHLIPFRQPVLLLALVIHANLPLLVSIICFRKHLYHPPCTTISLTIHSSDPSDPSTPSSNNIPTAYQLNRHRISTHSKHNISKPIQKLNLHTDTSSSPIPCNYSQAIHDLN